MSEVRRRPVKQLVFEDSFTQEPRLVRPTRTTYATHLLTNTHWTVIALLILLLPSLIHFAHLSLPEPQSPNEAGTRFSEVRAVRLLREWSDIGAKPSGSENNWRTAASIKQAVHAIASRALSSVRVEVDSQQSSGCFDIPPFDTEAFTVCYRNVSNIIVRIGRSSSPPETRSAVLLNCHFDSWPTSDGGSDDLVSCAIMAELMELLVRDPSYLENDVVLLFNGAEESELQASHGFITQHPWRRTIKAFMNLEASGSGGRELLFQAGPSNQWLLRTYVDNAVHPHCSVLGQEVFQSGVYPGDTDFRIFRDHGRIPGLDLAFVQNGYWWHTEFDQARRITPGSVQRAGENVYSTLRALLRSPYLDNPGHFHDEKYVFFDFMGLFVVVYRMLYADVLSGIVVLALVYRTVRTVTLSHFPSSLLLCAVSLAAPLLLHIGIVKLMSHVAVMSWYSNYLFAKYVYGLPSVAVAVLIHCTLLGVKEEKRKAFSRLHTSLISLLLAVLIAFVAYKRVASGYLLSLLALPVFTPTVARLFKGTFDPSTSFTLSYLLLSLPGMTMLLYTLEMILSIFVPIMGRNSSNPEVIIGLFVFVSYYVVYLTLCALLSRTSPVTLSTVRRGSFHLALACIAFVVVTLLRSPSPYTYIDEYPMVKRTQFYHTNMRLYDQNGSTVTRESGMFAISQDFRGAAEIPLAAGFSPHECRLDRHFCEIPFYFPTRNRINQNNLLYKKLDERFALKNPTALRIANKVINGHRIVYTFDVTGSDQISVFIVPTDGYTLVSTGVGSTRSSVPSNFLFLSESNLRKKGSWTFTVEIESTQSSSPPPSSSPLLVGAASHYLHGEDMKSPQIVDMERRLTEQRSAHPSSLWAITASMWNVDMVWRYF